MSVSSVATETRDGKNGMKRLGRWSAPALAAAIAAAGLAGFARSAPTEAADPEVVRTKAAIELAIKKDPSNSELWLHLAFIEKKLGHVDASQTAFEKCVSLNPRKGDAWYMLGLIYEKKKMKDEAIRAWKNCLDNARDAVMKEKAQEHLNHLQL